MLPTGGFGGIFGTLLDVGGGASVRLLKLETNGEEYAIEVRCADRAVTTPPSPLLPMPLAGTYDCRDSLLCISRRL